LYPTCSSIFLPTLGRGPHIVESILHNCRLSLELTRPGKVSSCLVSLFARREKATEPARQFPNRPRFSPVILISTRYGLTSSCTLLLCHSSFQQTPTKSKFRFISIFTATGFFSSSLSSRARFRSLRPLRSAVFRHPYVLNCLEKTRFHLVRTRSPAFPHLKWALSSAIVFPSSAQYDFSSAIPPCTQFLFT